MTDKTELEKARGDLDSQAHTLEEACYWTKQNGKGSVPILAVQEFINVVRTHREAAEAEIAGLKELLRETTGYFPGTPESEIIRPPTFNVEATNRSASLLFAQKEIDKLKVTIKNQAEEIKRLKAQVGDMKLAEAHRKSWRPL